MCMCMFVCVCVRIDLMLTSPSPSPSLIPFSLDVVASLMDPISFASKALENLAMGEFVSTGDPGKLPGTRLVHP